MLLLSERACRNPRFFFWLAGLSSFLFILLAAAPSLWPERFAPLHPIRVDTDPENMLGSDEPVRLFHNRMRQEFSLYDMVVVGVVNESHPQGVFNRDSLRDIYELTEFAKQIGWQSDGRRQGVIAADLIAPSTVDNIEQAGLGTVRFEWLMAQPPQNDAEAALIAARAQHIPFLRDTLISSDQRALALYIPITSKDLSYRVATELRGKIAEFSGDDRYYITGLPVAQDQFGVEMFKQMAISAPMAMALIFVLMWLFFRNLRLIVAPMIVAMVAVILTMGLLIVSGKTLHIMSSMIPIFIMPIAVLDAVHILSDFFDRYPQHRNRRDTLQHVMHELSAPMLYTSLTTAVGFLSLALTPIPPVQVFGIFVGFGVLAAWLLTITLVPAYIMLMPESSLAGFGMAAGDNEQGSWLARMLPRLGNATYRYAKLIIAFTLLLAALAYYGISKININDNPVKWFTSGHEIRIADRVLNQRFAGTYMAYLTFAAEATPIPEAEGFAALRTELQRLAPEVAGRLEQELDAAEAGDLTAAAAGEQLLELIEAQLDTELDDTEWEAWDAALLLLESRQQGSEPFKRPEVLRYLSDLQQHLQEMGLVGKINSLPDVIKTVHRELLLGEESAFRIPDTEAAVAQTLITYQSSHRPQDLWHFVTPDFQRTSLWLQLKSGDNRDMQQLVDGLELYLRDHPPPMAMQQDWFGLTYINLVWQQRMVSGMLNAFLGSFVVVLAMMVLLFRSLAWGLLSMIPLTFTIGLSYGIIGLIGKDYDMPVAVLSSLSLGLAVDYAIHFLARSREMRKKFTSWQETVTAVFGEPARAISRNIIVVGCGFLPLLAAPLVPYNTVGIFISTILLLAGTATLVLLPALIRLFEKRLFKQQAGSLAQTPP